jgi:outer membrane protein assembly factor BamB
MAGRLRNCRYCRVMLLFMTAAFALTLLGVTGIYNPLPTVNTWLNRLLALSKPEPRWTSRALGEPDAAAVMSDDSIVVTSRGFVEGMSPIDGHQTWRFDVNWAMPAIDVVVAQMRQLNPDAHPDSDRGYSVLDPISGAVIWADPDAIAAWAYANTILDLVCPGQGNCRIRSHYHRQPDVVWEVEVPAVARLTHGGDPVLAGTRDPAGWFGTAAAGTPGFVPPVFALPLDDGRIEPIDTYNRVVAQAVSAPDRLTRVAASSDQMLFIHAQRASSGCVYRVEAFNFATGKSTWNRNGYDLSTASGAGCEQRKDPLGADRHLVVTSSANEPMLVNADTGDPEWTGIPGEKVLAADYGIAVVESADRKTVKVIDVLAVPAKVTWTGEMGVDPQAAVTQEWVIIRDGDAGRLLVFRRFGMAQRLEIKTSATVIGYGPTGILISSGRRVGFHPLKA